MNLLELVAPLPRTEFIKDYFEKKPFLSIKNTRCEGLVGLNSAWIKKTLEHKEFPAPILDMADGSRRISKNRYTRLVKVGDEFIRLPDQKKLWKLHNSKKVSLMLQAVEQWEHAIADLTQHLVKNCYGYIGANIYCTPRGARTFPKHFDTHEVFIAQTEGHKKWNVWNPAYMNPRRGDKLKEQHCAPPDYSFTVKSGDILYIPRGFPHESEVTDCVSTHLTLGLSLLNVTDVLDFLATHSEGGQLRAGLLFDGASEWEAQTYPDILRTLEPTFGRELLKLATFAASLEKFGVQQTLTRQRKRGVRQGKEPIKYTISPGNFRYSYNRTNDHLTVATSAGVLELDGGISATLAQAFSKNVQEIEFATAQLPDGYAESLAHLVRIGVLCPGGKNACDC